MSSLQLLTRSLFRQAARKQILGAGICPVKSVHSSPRVRSIDQPVNFVRYAGLVNEDCKDNIIFVRQQNDFALPVKALSDDMKKIIKEVKKDMNVYVEGSLKQIYTIVEEDGRYMKKRTDFIRPSKIEILENDEAVDQKIQERRERLEEQRYRDRFQEQEWKSD